MPQKYRFETPGAFIIYDAETQTITCAVVPNSICYFEDVFIDVPDDTPIPEEPDWDLKSTIRGIYIPDISIGYINIDKLQRAITWDEQNGEVLTTTFRNTDSTIQVNAEGYERWKEKQERKTE